jgi:hypothetical protein
MTLFPESFFQFLVYGALSMTSLGVVSLIALLARDLRGRSLW